SVALGFATGVAAIVLTAWPEIGMRLGAGFSHSERAWVRDLGYHLLRLDGVREELLEACHAQATGGAVSAIAYLSGHGPLPRDEAQRLYYRVTGKAFEQESPAILAWRRRAFLRFDEHRGRDRVGPMGEGVRLASSRLDGRLEPQSAVSYFEWTMVFRNS